MKSYLGQIKWMYVSNMDQNGDRRLHKVVIVAQQGEQLKGIALSTKQCKALKGNQKPIWEGSDKLVYPAFNRGYQEMGAQEFKGAKVDYEMPKADRKRLVGEMEEFGKRFGFDVEG